MFPAEEAERALCSNPRTRVSSSTVTDEEQANLRRSAPALLCDWTHLETTAEQRRWWWVGQMGNRKKDERSCCWAHYTDSWLFHEPPTESVLSRRLALITSGLADSVYECACYTHVYVCLSVWETLHKLPEVISRTYLNCSWCQWGQRWGSAFVGSPPSSAEASLL